MANKVEQEILVKIKTIIEGLNEVKQYADTVKNLGKGGGPKSLTGDFVKAGVAAGGVAAATFKILSVLEQVGEVGARGLASFVAEGIRFNAIIESSKIGIATLVANTYDVRDASGQLLDPIQSFNASLEKSEELERALQKSAIETKFEFQDVLGFFNSSVLASAGLKTNLEQILSLTQGFSLAAGAANIEVEKVNTGIKQILTGNTTVRNDLARVLFPGLNTKEINSTLKAQREAGTLVDFLQKKLEVFKISGDTVAQSFEAVASNVKDALKVFEAASTHPLFDKLKQTLGFIINQIVDLSGDTVKLTPAFQKIADILGDVSELVGEALLSSVQAIFEWLSKIADYLIQNQDDIEKVLINVYSIAEQTAGIVLDLASIVSDTAQANSNTSNWVQVTRGLALFIAFIRDLLNIIVGTAEAIVGVFTQMAAIILNGITSGLLDLINLTKGWLNFLLPVALVLGRIASAVGQAGEDIQNLGTDRLISGLNFDSLANAANAVNKPFPTRVPSAKKSNFSFNARTGAHNGDAAASKREAAERQRNAQKLFDEIEKYQIANARRELEIGKETSKAILQDLTRRYDKGLVAAEDYYRQKKELALADLQQERQTLEKEQKFADQALSRDLGAIVGKFNLSPDELTATVAKLQAATAGDLSKADAKTIKQAQEYIKYLEQTAAIKQKKIKIDLEEKDAQADSTFETEKATRADKLLFDTLAGELESSRGNDALTERLGVQERASKQLHEALIELASDQPGVKGLAQALFDAGRVDISNLPKLADEFGVKLESLPKPVRLLIKLLERLQFLADLKGIDNALEKAKDTFKTKTDITQADFGAGRIGVDQANTQNADAIKPLIAATTAAYENQLAAINKIKATGGVVDQKELDHLTEAKAKIDAVTDSITGQTLANIENDAQREKAKFDAATEAVRQAQRAGVISAVEGRKQILAIQRLQIAALERELIRLLQIKEVTPQVAQSIADTQNQLAALNNDVNNEFNDFATGINQQIGGAFSDFLSTIINGTESIGGAFKKMLSGLLLGIANAIAQALLLKYILRPLGLGGGDDSESGGFGGLLGGFLHPGGGGHADGGIISGPGTGVSDSIPIAVSHGEGIIPARRVSQYGMSMIQSIIRGTFVPRMSFAGFAGGGFPGGAISGGGRATRIVNTVDPNLVRDFMQSASGEEIILNVIGRNPGVVQRLA